MDYFKHALELSKLDAAQIDEAKRVMDACEEIDGGEAEAARVVEVACLAHGIETKGERR